MKRILFVLASMLIFQLSKGQNSETAVTIHQEWNSGIFDKMWAFSYEYKNNMSTNEIYNDIVKKINDEKGVMHVGIYSADLIDGKWENVKPSNLNNPNYIVYHPSLSEDGKKLYFSSLLASWI